MKKHILAITPSPALDLSGVVEDLKPNEKSYVHEEVRSPGGNAINAARILTRLKSPVVASGFIGGSTGEEIKSLLDQEGVNHEFVPIQGSSRICVTVSNRRDHQQTRLTFPGPKIQASERMKLFEVVQHHQDLSLVMLGGSLPEGFPVAMALRILKSAKKNHIPCVVDCPGKILKELIRAEPFLIKPNLIEFQQMTGTSVRTLKAVIKEARKYSKQVPWICVSSVEGGAVLITESRAWFGRIPKIKIRSTVGAGDSMVGAMVSRLVNSSGQINLQEVDGGELLRWGLAASAATLSQAGTAFGSAASIREFYRKTQVKQIET